MGLLGHNGQPGFRYVLCWIMPVSVSSANWYSKCELCPAHGFESYSDKILGEPVFDIVHAA